MKNNLRVIGTAPRNNALANLIPHYPSPGPIRAFDKGFDERPFSQGGAFDTVGFDECWLKSGL